MQLPGAGLVSGDDGEAVCEVGGALERGQVDPRPAPLVVDDERERRAGVPEPAGGLGDDAGGVGLVVADEDELVCAGERGAGGRVVQAGAAVEHERADEL